MLHPGRFVDIKRLVRRLASYGFDIRHTQWSFFSRVISCFIGFLTRAFFLQVSRGHTVNGYLEGEPHDLVRRDFRSVPLPHDQDNRFQCVLAESQIDESVPFFRRHVIVFDHGFRVTHSDRSIKPARFRYPTQFRPYSVSAARLMRMARAKGMESRMIPAAPEHSPS